MDFVCKITLGETLNAILLAITGWSVWYYAKETHKINKIKEQPVINLTIEEQDNNVNKWYILNIKNIGHVPAYNVIFSPLTSGIYTYYPYFRHKANPIIENGQVLELHFWVKKAPNSTEVYERVLGFKHFLERFFPPNTEASKYDFLTRTSAIFLINYEGVNGKKYHSVFRIYSKMWPIIVPDLVSELIHTGEDLYTLEQAKELCITKAPIPKFPTS